MSLIKIELNGVTEQIKSNLTISSFLTEQGYKTDKVAVAINQDFIPRSQHQSTLIKQDDAIEIVAPMQGG